MLEVKGLTRKFSRGGRFFTAVDNVDLSVSPGDFVCIIGRSGSGKTTLLNLIDGLLRPTSGEALIEGRNIFAMTDAELSYCRNAKIGYIPQGQSILNSLSVLDNVRLPFYLSRREGNSEEKASALLDQVGILHLAQSSPKQLSGGELRRVAIARALMNGPALLVADEPTSDLDTQTTAEIMELFRQITQTAVSVLMVTHELDTTAYGNRLYKMDAGVLTEQYNIKE